MLIDDQELKERLESPLNLLNRLRHITNPHRSQTRGEIEIPSLPPTAAELVPNLEDKIQHGALKSKAMGLITQAMDELKVRMPEVQKPRELAAIAADMSKIVTAVQPTANLSGANAPQIVIYAPQIRTEDTYNVVELNEI